WVTSGQRVHSAIERSPARTRPTSLRPVYASLLYALMLDDTGDSAQGIEWCERARTQAEGQASAWIGGVYSVLGYLLVQTGRVAEGLGYQERALAHQQRIGFRGDRTRKGV